MGEFTDKLKGTVKEATGRVTGDDSMQREGKLDQFSGDVKGKGNHLRDKATSKVDQLRGRMHRKDDPRT